MQEDKQLKEWLMKYAVEHPAPDFTNRVMQRATVAYNYNTKPFFKQSLPRVLLVTFILVSIVVFVLSFKIPASAINFQLTAMLPAKYVTQCFSFLVAFWVVIILNFTFRKLFTSIHNC